MSSHRAGLRAAAARGANAGLAGVAAMTAAEKVEQAATGRPNSYVPASALFTLLGRTSRNDAATDGVEPRDALGNGALLGALRGIWSATGIRGGEATMTKHLARLRPFAPAHLAQVLEDEQHPSLNWTSAPGVPAPPGRRYLSST